jgi:transglutaminase-like putative cysteine protease
VRSVLTHSVWATQLPLLDHAAVDWSRVKRARYFCYQRFYYVYPGPVRSLRQRLIVIPPDRYGDQAVIDRWLTVAPHPAVASERVDTFGNRVWELHVTQIEREIAFEAIVTIERARPLDELFLSDAEVAWFREPTELTAADARISAVARELAARARDHEECAERISAWVADTLSYASGLTGVRTTAAQALAIGKGLCQDYAHIMLAICRAAGLPARYVSGHMLAEGGSHAWVEVLLPTSDNRFRAIAFDPTNRRRPNMSYAIVAVGRDYRDVAPTSGSFTAPYGGQLSFTKRAGLTLVEFADGELVGSDAITPV